MANVIRMVDLIDATVDRIVKKGFDPNQSPFAHKVAVMLTTAQGIIDNGGFEYFFGLPFHVQPNMEDFVAVYESVGANRSAKAFEEAISRSKTPDPTYEDLNQILWAESESNYKQLEAYIEAHRDLFI
jgi:hypothetical protein